MHRAAYRHGCLLCLIGGGAQPRAQRQAGNHRHRPRAVVSAASYEARKYGINSAMPAARAHRLCPNGIFLPVDMAYYRMMSHRIMHEVFLTVTDRFEQVSVDEGYMDVSAALLEWGRPSAIGAWILRSGGRALPRDVFSGYRL